MALKPPMYEPHGAVRNAASNPKKVDPSSPVLNASTSKTGSDRPTESYICNESAPMKGRGVDKPKYDGAAAMGKKGKKMKKYGQ